MSELSAAFNEAFPGVVINLLWFGFGALAFYLGQQLRLGHKSPVAVVGAAIMITFLLFQQSGGSEDDGLPRKTPSLPVVMRVFLFSGIVAAIGASGVRRYERLRPTDDGESLILSREQVKEAAELLDQAASIPAPILAEVAKCLLMVHRGDSVQAQRPPIE